jgi:outer membrane protein assembly factor BamB
VSSPRALRRPAGPAHAPRARILDRARALVAAIGTALLVACGGGGGDEPPPPAPEGPAYPLRDAMNATLMAGASYAFRVKGTCVGTAEQVDSPPAPARVGGADRWVVSTVLTVRLVNCLPSQITQTQATLFDTSFTPLSVSSPGESWVGRYTPPTPYPATIHAGESGSLGSIEYTLSGAPGVSLGRDDLGWTAEPETGKSVIFNRTVRSYDSEGTLEYVQQDRFRIGTSGAAQLISVTLVDESGSGMRLELTPGADLRPPAVVSTTPTADQAGVPIGAAVSVTFDEPIDPASVSPSTLTLKQGPTLVVGRIDASGSTLSFVPSRPLQGETRFDAVLSAGVRDLAGNAMPAGRSWSFTTGRVPDLTPPTVVSVGPADGATGVPRASAVTAVLSEAPDPASLTPSTFTLTANGAPVTGTVSANGTTVTFRPAATLAGATTFVATLGTGIRDTSGNALALARTWSFTTAPASPVPPLGQAVTYQGDYAHTGVTTLGGTAPSFPASPAWSTTLPGAVSYPLIASGRIFVTTAGLGAGYGTQLHAFDAATGAVAWGPVAIPGTYFWSGTAFDQGTVFVLNADGVLRAFDAATGTQRWSVKMPAQHMFGAPPVAVDGTVYVHGSGSGGTLFAIDSASGAVRWQTNLGGGGNGSPAVVDDAVYVSYPCYVHRIDALTGAIAWTWSGGCIGGGGRTPVVANGSVYARDTLGGSGVILNASTGVQTGTFGAGSPSHMPAVTAQSEFIVANGTLQAFDVATRAVRWSFTGDGTLASVPILIDGTVVVGAGSGAVHALDASTGATRWSGSAGAPVYAPDEQNYTQPLTGLGAGEGWLAVPAGNRLTVWRVVP